MEKENRKSLWRKGKWLWQAEVNNKYRYCWLFVARHTGFVNRAKNKLAHITITENFYFFLKVSKWNNKSFYVKFEEEKKNVLHN